MINLANMKKTWYYLQKNGIGNTYYAVMERLFQKNSDLYPDKDYCFMPVGEEECNRQRAVSFEKEYKFSILVPMYETKPEFAKAMVDSVLNQTYPHFELILADASKSDIVADTVNSYRDNRICYLRLEKNRGISENTNGALAQATGDYVGLLDHDDILTPDALFEMASCLNQAWKEGKEVAFVYSNEDKCDSYAEKFYEPNIKPRFNFDLLLSNNYICHFLVMKTELMKQLKFRPVYDGAQDFDLVLRAALHKNKNDEIRNIDKVLYHWRCHDDSTAANPRSKQYAYEAGKRAVADALEVFLAGMHPDMQANMQANVQVVHTKHNGFYRILYGNESAEDIFAVRKDVGIIAGSVKKNGKITGGIKDGNGKCPFAGLPVKFSGYLHRNVLQQDCEQADLDNAIIRPELVEKLRKEDGLNLDLTKSVVSEETMQISDEDAIQICKAVSARGYKILYDPFFEKKMRVRG